MKYFNLKGTNLIVSCVALGTGVLNSRVDGKTSEQILDAYIGNGGTFIDTANNYGRWAPYWTNRAEQMIGNWMKQHRMRSHIVLATKGGAREPHTMAPRLTVQTIREDLESSLQALQTDYVDIYYYHRDNIEKNTVGELMETMNEFRKAGKIRYLGVSNWTAKRLWEAKAYSQEHDIPFFAVDEMMYNLACVNQEEIDRIGQFHANADILDFHNKTQMPMTAYSSQAYGIFKNALLSDFNENPKFADARAMYGNEVTYRRIQRVQEFKALTGFSEIEITLGFLYAQGFQIIPIIGPWRVEELEESVAASDCRLTKKQLDFLLS